MKVTTKRISFMLLCAACALLIALGASMPGAGIALGSAVGETATESGYYYYDNLKDATGNDYTLAKTFYRALDQMNENGDFKDGIVQYSLADVLTSQQIEAWVMDGNLTIPKAFSAARDSYVYDHPELFYVDLYKLTISAGRTNGAYSAYIDCGLEPDCYIDGSTLTSTEAVDTAIINYNNKINEIAALARAYAKNNNYGIEQDKLLADYVNEYLATNVKYDYEAFEASTASGQYAKPFMGNAYGALVIGECVCSGYSFAYKAILDKLEIPCVVVSGHSLSKGTDGSAIEKGEAHSWNYVWLTTPTDDAEAKVVALDDEVKAAWYAYDVTWNSNCENKNSYNAMNAFTTSRNHSADPVVSSSGYLMPYPDLCMITYGNTTIDNEFMHSYIYKPESGKTDPYGNQLMSYNEYVSYKGMSAVALLKEGLHIIQRAYAFNQKTQKMYWTAWFDVGGAIKEFGWEEADDGKQTEILAFYGAQYIQYAVVGIAPDLKYNPDAELIVEGNSNIYYSHDNAELGKNTLFISEIYTNKTYGTYTAAPYVLRTTPKHTGQNFISESMAGADGIMKDQHAFTIEVTYDEDLHVLDESQPIGIEFTSQFANIYQYAKLIPVNANGDFVELVDNNKLRFKFKPSLMYEHNMSLYSFYFSNVGSSKLVGCVNGTYVSNKLPNPVHYNFERQYTACNQILGGGRLWIDCCAQPTLVSNSDLAAMDFKDEDGNSTFSEQARSQMMLVAERATSETENAMLNSINKDFGIKNKDLKASETYDINLQICGKYPKIADGSYVKIALGFPEGYGPKDEGVVFKLYHRKHISGDKYIIEEVPCVVTQFGIVATVTSFSPYMVAAVDAKKVSATKTVYATIDGKGGTLSKEDGKVRSLNPGDSYTYTINPDEGYGLYRVMLNGEDVTNDVVDGKLTVSYENMLNNNEVVIQYISAVAAQRYADIELEIVEPVKVIVSTSGDASLAVLGKDLPMNTVLPTKINIALVVGVSVAVAVVVAGIAVAVVLIMKAKKSKQQEA